MAPNPNHEFVLKLGHAFTDSGQLVRIELVRRRRGTFQPCLECGCAEFDPDTGERYINEYGTRRGPNGAVAWDGPGFCSMQCRQKWQSLHGNRPTW